MTMRLQTTFFAALLVVTIFTRQQSAADTVNTYTVALAGRSGTNNNGNAIEKRRALKAKDPKMTKSSKKAHKAHKSPKDPEKSTKKSTKGTKTPKMTKKKSSGKGSVPTVPKLCPKKIESIIQSKYGNAGIGSAQAKALTWLIGDITEDDCDREDRIIQRYVLAVFYYSTGGDKWKDVIIPGKYDSGWLESGDECSSWDGLSCDENQKLTEIRLSFKNLVGTIPNEIGALLSLQEMNLGYNELSGTIPDTIGDLVNLERLDLVALRTGLMGTLPDLSKLVNMIVLDFSLNGLTGSIAGIFDKFTNLEIFRLNNNGLTGNIPDLSLNKNLRDLQLIANNFSGGLDPKLFQLPRLDTLDLRGNELTGPIPDNFGGSTSLIYIYLDDNLLTGTIPGITGNTLQSLESLNLHKNKLSGPVPISICELNDDDDDDDGYYYNYDYYDWILRVDCRPIGNAQNECPPNCCTECYEGKGLP